MRHGTPPRPEECRDAGRLHVPKYIDVTQIPSGFIAHMGDVLTKPLPKRSRVREALVKLREEGLPAKAQVDGLGMLVAGEEGWEVK